MDDLTRHLETMLGPGSMFREGQRQAIEAVTEDGHRALVVQRTGWGKSLVYWIATRVRRDAGHGPTLIISPLLSLMRNQIALAERLGLRATTINSSNREHWETIRDALAEDRVDVLLIAPERLANDEFLTGVLPSIQGSIGLFVVDEAHCISDWGHDFRPDYRRIGRILARLDPRVPVLATTATANDRVVADIEEQLGARSTTIRGPLARSSLALDVIDFGTQADRLAWIASRIPTMTGSGIVYCLTVADTQRVATFLQANGIDARPYSADLGDDERSELEDALVANELKALVATVALGMGFDKPDLGFVIHYQRPASVIAYYQQVGRAGRAMDDAEGILLTGREDDDIADYFLDTAFPPTVNMQEILDALGGADSMSIAQLEKVVNLRRGRIEQALKLLEIDGAVARDGSRYLRTPNPWSQDEERIERVKAQRRIELAEMAEYVSTTDCRMEFLARRLDDPDAAPCGRCSNCLGPRQPHDADPELVLRAIDFLRRAHRPIKPRQRWPVGAEDGFSGAIKPANEPGMALCVYGDAGWGAAVKRGKYTDREFSDALVEASVQAIRDHWPMDPAPEWVTALPSAAQAGIVDRFARRVAARMSLPYAETLSVRAGALPQKELQNSAQQLHNALGKLDVDGSLVRPGPVLLIDDIVDSGWTLTVAGWLLGTHGSGPVYPFALAQAAGRDG